MAEKDFLAQFIEEPIYLIEKNEMPTSAASNDSEEIETTPVVEESESVYVRSIPTMGENLKHCIVLVNSEDELLADHLKTLLFKILGSVKRSPEDILVANCREADKDQIEAILANNNHRHIIDFGTGQLNLPSYQLHKDGNVFQLKADTLEEIDTDVEKKKALWKALQEMFL